MSNMGYCRFQNTLQDLQDCQDHITDCKISEEEKRARERLVEVCRSIVEDFEDAEMEEAENDEDD